MDGSPAGELDPRHGMRQAGGEDSPETVPEAFVCQVRYEKVVHHSQGGLGVICRSYDSHLHREVAVKVIREKWSKDETAREQFAVEAEITGRLDHPGIVPVYAAGILPDGKHFYSMRYIEGHDLAEDIEHFYKQASPLFDSLEFRDLLQKFISACKTIAYAHNRGIVHRDLKPQNIRVGRFGETVVLDWGLASVVNRSDAFKQSGEATIILSTEGSGSGNSSSGAGTPAYMSPEQHCGLAPTPASDVYSLGATLYKLITGRSVTDGLSGPIIGDLLREGRWTKPRDHQPALPKQLEAICLKAMAIQPAHRFSTAMELANEVERFLAGLAVQSYIETPAEKLARWVRKHQSWVRHLAVALVILAVTSFCIAVYMVQLANNSEVRRVEAEEQHHQASLAKEDATNAKKSALLLSSQLAARTVAADIELRGAILREEAASSKLRELTKLLNQDPESAKSKEDLKNWLRDRYLARLVDSLPTSSWSIYNENGVQIARVSPMDEGSSAKSLGKSFRHRDYFHGQGVDFQENSPSALSARPHDFNVHVSAVFLSSNTNKLSVSFSVPIMDAPVEESERQVIGILSSSVQLDRLNLLPSSILVDTRIDSISGTAQSGLVLRHPQLTLSEDTRTEIPRLGHADLMRIKDATRRDSQNPVHAADEKSASRLIDLIDPVTKEPLLAAVEAVYLPNQSRHSSIGWTILIKDLSTTPIGSK